MEAMTVPVVPVHVIETAARREQAAERNRAHAEAAWRQAWWATTLALGAAPEGDRQAVTAALDTAERILGQSRHWLSSRRRAGQMLAGQPAAAVSQLPPRLAVAYREAGGEPGRAVAVLQDAEARKLSLRDFAAELGTQPQSWLRENEQHQRPVTIGQLAARPPAEQAALIRQALLDPAVASRVFDGPRPALPLALPSRDSGPRPHRPLSRPAPDPGKPDVLALLGTARDDVERAFKLSVLRGLAGDEQVLDALERLETEAGFLRRYQTGAAVDEAITQIMSDAND